VEKETNKSPKVQAKKTSVDVLDLLRLRKSRKRNKIMNKEGNKIGEKVSKKRGLIPAGQTKTDRNCRVRASNHVP